LLVALLIVSPTPTCFAQEDFFPPLISYPKSEASNDLSAQHISTHLKALGEPSLWKASQKDASARSYRFLWLATGEHPICVRVSRAGDAVSLRVSRHDGSPGIVAGKLSLERTEALNLKQWDRLDELVEKSKFWSAPASVKETRGIADGDSLTIEGIRAGTYHVIDRAGLTTGEAYKSVGRYMLGLARSDAIAAWDRRRDRERNTPGYRVDPPETEDLGVLEFIEEGFFPDLIFYPKDKDRDAEERDANASRLWQLRQRSLLKLARSDRTAQAYRIYWWTDDGDSVCVRAILSGDAASLHLVQLDPDGEHVTVDVERKLAPAQWAGLVELVDASDFWSAAATVRPTQTLKEADYVLLEGVREGRFHLAERRSDTMTSSFKNLCRQMLMLSGSDALPIWDRWRKDSRNDSKEQAEPVQVPDLDGKGYLVPSSKGSRPDFSAIRPALVAGGRASRTDP
jgi:hypothetical protein